MVWSRWIEDTIYHIFYVYDIKSHAESQSKLKALCIKELNAHPSIKEEIKTDNQLKFFIMQIALENLKKIEL